MVKEINVKKCVLTAVIAAALLCATAAADVIYVDDGASPGGNGQTWGTAYKYLQDAMQKPPTSGDQIWVAEGTYKPGTSRTDTFDLISGVDIYGGFSGVETNLNERDWAANVTILSGDIGIIGDNSDNSYHVVTGISINEPSVLDGFTITAGRADAFTPDDRGAGMYNSQAFTLIVNNCIFIDNYANHSGAGMYNLINGNPTVTNCIFVNNSSLWSGGGMFNDNNANPTIINCTFWGNSATSEIGRGGAIWTVWSYPTIINSILWANTAPYGPQIYIDGGTITVSYCNVQGGQAAVYIGDSGGTVNWGQGNIDVDPCFVDPYNGYYHLKSEGWRWDGIRQRWDWDEVTSRCIDAGNPGSPLSDELLSIPDDPSNIWGQNLRVNMGAFGGTEKASIPPYDWTVLSDVTNDGISDLSEFDILLSLWLYTGEQLYADFERDGDVDLFDFALLAKDWLQETSWH